jgi:hypothetical protein
MKYIKQTQSEKAIFLRLFEYSWEYAGLIRFSLWLL